MRTVAATPGHLDLRETLRQVHVFIPYEIQDGREVSPEYDTPEYRAQLQHWFALLGLAWTWRPITLENAREVVARIARAPQGPGVVFNLCDGTEVDGYPGLTVIRALEDAGVPFTGAGSRFYGNTNGKLEMKDLLAASGVTTPAYASIEDPARDVPRAGARLGYPLIVKPIFSAASYGISPASVVHDDAEALARVVRLRTGVHGYRFPDVLVERFVIGREFTVLVTGSAEWDCGVRVHPPIERAFHAALPLQHRFLTYERLWEKYDEETPPPGHAPAYSYSPVAADLGQRLSQASRDAYVALGGTGYARVDLRLDADTDAVHVIEVNANCGLSDDGETSISWILGLSGTPFPAFLEELLTDAGRRRVAGP